MTRIDDIKRRAEADADLPEGYTIYPHNAREDIAWLVECVERLVTLCGATILTLEANDAYEALPPEIREMLEEDLPTLADLRGIAPNCTGDEQSEDFIRRIRDKW